MAPLEPLQADTATSLDDYYRLVNQIIVVYSKQCSYAKRLLYDPDALFYLVCKAINADRKFSSDKGNLYGYRRVVVVNGIKSWLGRKRHKTYPLPNNLYDTTEPIDRLIKEEELERLNVHIGKLPAQQKRCIELFLDNVSMTNIAANMHTSRNNSYTLFNRAVKNLRRSMSDGV